MNEDYILEKIEPYLNEQGMLGEKDFDRLFYMISKQQQYKVIDILINHNIEIDYINRSINRRRATDENSDARIRKKLNLEKLTNEQLCVLFQQGYKQALEALIMKNENLIWSRVKRYVKIYNHKLDEDDLYQSGCIGMIIAAKKYDSSKESKFVTYAIWWIDQRILREIMDYGFTIRIPVHVFESISKILRAFNNNLGCSKDEVFEILQPHGFSREQFEFLMNLASNILSIASLNTYVGENEDSELYEFIVDESRTSTEDEVYMAALKHKVSEVLKTLTPREQKVINLRFGIEDDRKRTLEEIGDEFNVTRERIRQIEANALKKLRHPTRSRLLRDFIGG